MQMQNSLATKAIDQLKGVQLPLWLLIQIKTEGQQPAEVRFNELGPIVEQLGSSYWSVGKALTALERKGFLRKLPGSKRHDRRYLVTTRIEDMPDYDPDREPVKSLGQPPQAAPTQTPRVSGALSDGQRKELRDYIHDQRFHQWSIFELNIQKSGQIRSQYPGMELLPALKQHFETVMWPEIQQGITCDTQLLEAYDSVKAQVNARMNRR